MTWGGIVLAGYLHNWELEGKRAVPLLLIIP